jgi:hypothetical protein
VGSGTRQEVLAMGDTPNIAARIQGLAESHTVALRATTARLVQGPYLAPAMGPTLAMGRCRHVKLNKLDQTLAGGHEALRLAHALAYPLHPGDEPVWRRCPPLAQARGAGSPREERAPARTCSGARLSDLDCLGNGIAWLDTRHAGSG